MPWQRIACASYPSPFPQSPMDMGRTGAFLAATSLKGAAGSVGWNGWIFNILSAHSTGKESSLWSQQVSLSLGSATTSRLFVVKEWIVKQWMHFSHCWWSHCCWCIFLPISEHPCSVEALCYQISFCDTVGLEKRFCCYKKLQLLGEISKPEIFQIKLLYISTTNKPGQ